MLLTRSDDEVFGGVVLEHQPHTFDIVTSITPVTQGIEVAQIELVLFASCDASHGKGDLTRDEGLTTAFALVVEKDTIDGEHPIALAVVLGDPEAIELSYAIGGTRIEGSCLPLRNFLHQPVEFGGRGLIDFGLLLKSKDADRFQET